MLKTLPYGYKLQTGAILSDSQVDSYNALQEQKKAFEAAGMPVPDYISIGSRNLMVDWHNNSLT